MEVKTMDFTRKIVLKGQYQKKKKKPISPKEVEEAQEVQEKRK